MISVRWRWMLDGLLLAVTAAGTPVAQLLMRESVYSGRALIKPVDMLFAPANLAAFLGGFALYFAAMLAGLVLIWRWPVSIAYPVIVGATIVTSATLAVLTGSDSFSIADFAGMIFIIGGVVMLAPGLTRE